MSDMEQSYSKIHCSKNINTVEDFIVVFTCKRIKIHYPDRQVVVKWVKGQDVVYKIGSFDVNSEVDDANTPDDKLLDFFEFDKAIKFSSENEIFKLSCNNILELRYLTRVDPEIPDLANGDEDFDNTPVPRETVINDHVDLKSLDNIPLVNTGYEMVQDDVKTVPVMKRNVKVGHVKRKLGIADSKLLKRRKHSTIKAREPFHRFNKLKCEHCNKTFQRQLSYLLHKATHSFEMDKGNYACNTCHKKYTSSVQLINHKRLCLSPDFICKFCNKKLMSEELLTYHVNNSCSAFKVTNYTCPKCDREFVTQNGFVKHRRKQACEMYKFESENKKKANPCLVLDVKRLQCELCGKVYANKSSLAKHIRRHKGIKNYKCQVCNKCFGDNNQLKAHHRMHSGEKPFLCNKCGKSFGHAGHLNRHIKKHDGTSFVCSQCGKSYMDSNGLTKHMNSHSRNEINREQSSYIFNMDSNGLTKHMNSHSRNEISREQSSYIFN